MTAANSVALSPGLQPPFRGERAGALNFVSRDCHTEEMSIKQITSILGTALLALGLSVAGATAANAAGTYTVMDQCGTRNDTVAVTGDYWIGYGGTIDGPKTWTVSDIKLDSPNPADPERFVVAEGVFDGTPCPPPPAPSEPPAAPAPEQTVVAPTTQTTTTSRTAPSTTEAAVAAPAPDATTATTEPSVEPSPSASSETTDAAEVTMTAASDVTPDGGGNLIIPIGGAVLIASAIGTLGYGVGKLGWFRR